MSFPVDELAITVEIELDAVWTDITEFVYVRDGIVITRGRADEGSATEPSTCRFTLNNRDGRFSPRNPVGIYYGVIGRNTKVRLMADLGDGPITRFAGEISAWPVGWDISGKDVFTSVEAAGILRRLGQGVSPLRSAFYRAATNTDTLRAYWPGEDPIGSTQVASGLPGNAAMITSGREPDFAADSSFATVAPLLKLNEAKLHGVVPNYTATDAGLELRFLLNFPPDEAMAGETIASLNIVGGRYTRLDLTYLFDSLEDGGGLYIFAYNGSDIDDAVGPLWFGLTTPITGYVTVAMTDATGSGHDSDLTLTVRELDGTMRYSPGSVEVTGTTGIATSVDINRNESLTDVTVGHINVAVAADDLVDALDGYSGERAGRRIERLCAEESITFDSIGDLDTTAAMGGQRPLSLLDLIREAVEADLGILSEKRDVIGLRYRTREDLYNRAPDLAVDYGALSELGPIEDDQAVRNDVTVRRTAGSSARAVLATGALSTLPPPLGIGRYDNAVEINVESDTALPDQAGWRLSLGTIDEARYPVIVIALHSPGFAADSALTAAALLLDQGDRITVSELPTWLPPDTVSQLAQGFAETLRPYGYSIAINATPESAYHVVELDSAMYGRLDAEDSELDEDLSTSETDVDVSGELWITTADRPGDFPFDVLIGGEAMTVTSCTGASSPQTFTVTRSVNGVVKTHSAGAIVRVREPVVLAL